jgi:hypothetical protein
MKFTVLPTIPAIGALSVPHAGCAEGETRMRSRGRPESVNRSRGRPASETLPGVVTEYF